MFVWLKCALALALVFAAFAGCGENQPATFASTLEDMRADFGDDARVVEVRTTDEGIEWQVLTGETVSVRSYRTESSTSRNPTTGSYNTETDRVEETEERPAERGDEASAKLTLADLDPGALIAICERTGIAELTGDYRLRGDRWRISFARAEWSATFDGSSVKRESEKNPYETKITSFCSLGA